MRFFLIINDTYVAETQGKRKIIAVYWKVTLTFQTFVKRFVNFCTEGLSPDDAQTSNRQIYYDRDQIKTLFETNQCKSWSTYTKCTNQALNNLCQIDYSSGIDVWLLYQSNRRPYRTVFKCSSFEINYGQLWKQNKWWMQEIISCSCYHIFWLL